jgi:hypothetical protein
MLLERPTAEPTAIRTQFGAFFVSLELSRLTWVVTSFSRGNGWRMSRRGVTAGQTGELLALFAELRRKPANECDRTF